MSRKTSKAVLALLATLGLSIAGCGGGPAATEPPEDSTASPSDAHAHEHPDHGPRGGDLVELGNEEYHAEVIHESDGKLSVYILDAAAKVDVPIEATEIMLNVVHDGAPEQFKLAASPVDSDPDGQSSRFVSIDEHAGADLDHDGTQAKLAVTINGTSYQGAIEHDHGHSHGDHDHGEHKHDDGDHEHPTGDKDGADHKQ